MTSPPEQSEPTGHPGPDRSDDRGRDFGIGDPGAARQLWDALILARGGSPVISAAEDAVFRFYLPLAHTLVQRRAALRPDQLAVVEQAAELGLAKAVLAWRGPDSDGFFLFVRAAIESHIRRYGRVTGEQHPRRSRALPPPHETHRHHSTRIRDRTARCRVTPDRRKPAGDCTFTPRLSSVPRRINVTCTDNRTGCVLDRHDRFQVG